MQRAGIILLEVEAFLMAQLMVTGVENVGAVVNIHVVEMDRAMHRLQTQETNVISGTITVTSTVAQTQSAWLPAIEFW